jgi:hypothetical protein
VIGSYPFSSDKYLNDLMNTSQWITHVFMIQITSQNFKSIFYVDHK